MRTGCLYPNIFIFSIVSFQCRKFTLPCGVPLPPYMTFAIDGQLHILKELQLFSLLNFEDTKYCRPANQIPENYSRYLTTIPDIRFKFFTSSFAVFIVVLKNQIYPILNVEIQPLQYLRWYGTGVRPRYYNTIAI